MAFMHFDESIKILNEQKLSTLKSRKLPLMEALGYVLAEDIVAEYNSPEAPTAGMDGYAIRFEDMKLKRLKISGINPAGARAIEPLKPKEAIKTFTGSLMPLGSDTLIPIENVSVEDDEIIINEEVPKGFSVRPVGENFKKGELLIPKGTKLNYPQIGVLASLNRVYIEVYSRPKVAILSTGSELLELGESQTKESQIRSSNNYTIEAIVKQFGGEAIQMGCVGDNKAVISKAIDNALNQADILVTTGGVSVGDFDFVKDVVLALDAKLLFRGVRIKPGQHIIVARLKDKFIVALPGFAYSSTVTALLYLVPLIAKFQNSPNPLKLIKATLKEPFKKRAKKAEFTACNLRLEDGRYFVDFEGKRFGTSAILTNMLGDIGLLYTSEDEGDKKAGSEVEILKII